MLEVLQDISQIMIYVVGIIVIGLVLLQGGAGDVGSAFGGGGQLDGTLGVGANKKLAKLTAWLSLLFVVMIVILAMKPSEGFTEGAAGTDAGDETEVVVPGTEPEATIVPIPADEGSAEPTPTPPPALPEEEVEREDDAASDDAEPLSDPPTPPAGSGSGISFGDEDEEPAAEDTP